MRSIILASLVFTGAEAYGADHPIVQCEAEVGVLEAVYDCGLSRYEITYNLDEGAGSYTAQLLATGSGDLTFEEYVQPGEGTSVFFVSKAKEGYTGEFGGKGLKPVTFFGGQCEVSYTTCD